jgi:hypothetical protein
MLQCSYLLAHKFKHVHRKISGNYEVAALSVSLFVRPKQIISV